MQGDCPGLVPDNAIDSDATPRLKCLDCCLGQRSKLSVNPLRGYAPLTFRAIGEKRLKAANYIPGRALLKRWHGATIGQCVPSERTNDAVDRQARALLELLYCRL